MIKKGYGVQLTYEVSDAEKKQAEKALLYFDHTLKLLDLASDHLNIMKTPFKESPEMDPKAVLDARTAIRRFRDQVIKNFNDFKSSAFQCVNIMQLFSSDTQTIKLIKSFISAVEDLEIKVNSFVDLFKDLENKDFSKNTVNDIEAIQKQCDNVEELIDDRIKNHIQTNILATSWVDSVGNNLQMKIEKKRPLILDLFNKRQDELNQVLKERNGK